MTAIIEADGLGKRYGRCSKWLRRHRKSTEVNYVAPEVDEMEAELTLVQTWHDRVRKYANT